MTISSAALYLSVLSLVAALGGVLSLGHVGLLAGAQRSVTALSHDASLS